MYILSLIPARSHKRVIDSIASALQALTVSHTTSANQSALRHTCQIDEFTAVRGAFLRDAGVDATLGLQPTHKSPCPLRLVRVDWDRRVRVAEALPHIHMRCGRNWLAACLISYMPDVV